VFFYDYYNRNVIIIQIVSLVDFYLYQFDITDIKVVDVNKDSVVVLSGLIVIV